MQRRSDGPVPRSDKVRLWGQVVSFEFLLFFFGRDKDKKRKQKLTFSVLSLFSLRSDSYFPNNEKRGFWLLTPFQVILFVGISIALTITAAISFQKVVALLDPTSSWGGAVGGGLGRWIVIFMAINLCVVQIPSFHSLSSVSMIGTLASVFYALVAFIASLVHGHGGGADAEVVSYQFGAAKSSESREALILNAASAIATIAFAYGGTRELEKNGEERKKETERKWG